MKEHTPNDPPDLEDAYSRLRELGFDEAVFDFNFLTQDGRRAETAPHRTQVLVSNTENLSHKVYDVANGAHWTARFGEDVKAGLFGKPPKGATSKMAL